MGLETAVEQHGPGNNHHDDDDSDASHGDIMVLLREMQKEQREFAKAVNLRLEAIEAHNEQQDRQLKRGARHMAATDGDLGALADLMKSAHAIENAAAVAMRAADRLRNSSARPPGSRAADPTEITRPHNERPEPDTMPAPAPESQPAGPSAEE